MDLLEVFNFIMIYIVHKISILIKNHLNYLKEDIFGCFFKKYNRVVFFFFNFHNI